MEGSLDVKSLFKPKKKLVKTSSVDVNVVQPPVEESPALPESPELVKTAEEKKPATSTWGSQQEEEKPVVVQVVLQEESAGLPKKYVPPSSRLGASASSVPSLSMPSLAESMKELERPKTIVAVKTVKSTEENAKKEKEKEERKRQLQEEMARAAVQVEEKVKDTAASFEEVAAKYADRHKIGRKQMLVF